MTVWNEALARAELVAAGAALAREGLIRGREGNLSCRLPDGRLLLTPRGTDKGRLTGARLVACRLDEPLPAEVSSEALMHFAIYRHCPAVGAIVHAHPPFVLSLESRGRLPSPSSLKEGEAVVPKIARVPLFPPGSPELAEACARALKRAPLAVMARHGAVAVGSGPADALARLEVAELLARIALVQPGGVLL